jgi:hypothetical protein
LGQERDRRSTHDAGFDLHLTKPASIEAIEELLRKASGVISTKADL